MNPWNIPEDCVNLAFKLIICYKKVNFADFYYWFKNSKTLPIAVGGYNRDKHHLLRLSYDEARMLMYVLQLEF